MSESTDRALDALVVQQARTIQKWLGSTEARECAEQLLRRLDLPTQHVDDLLSDTWLRVERTFSRRHQPLQESVEGRTEVRYAQRSLEYAAVDLLRAQLRRERIRLELRLLASATVSSSAEEIAVHAWSASKMVLACRDRSRPIDCRGCRPDVVREVAARVVASLHADPSQSLDDLIYEGLGEVLGVGDDGVRPDVLRARKSRCGPCVTRLLQDVARELHIDPWAL